MGSGSLKEVETGTEVFSRSDWRGRDAAGAFSSQRVPGEGLHRFRATRLRAESVARFRAAVKFGPQCHREPELTQIELWALTVDLRHKPVRRWANESSIRSSSVAVLRR